MRFKTLKIERILNRVPPVNDRTLALLRVAVGVMLLRDFWEKITGISMYIAPNSVPDLAGLCATSWYNEIPNAFGFYAVFLCVAVLYACFTAGVFSKVLKPVTFVVYCLLNERGYLYGHSGSVVLALVLFWLMFLPTENCWSVDSVRFRKPPEPCSPVAWLAYLCQLAIIYVATSLTKLAGPEWKNGNAIYDVLNSRFAHDLPRDLFNLLPLWAMHAVTWVTLSMEMGGAFLVVFSLILPRRQELRVVAWITLVGLHLGIHAGVNINDFSLIMIASLTALIPPLAWDRLALHGTPVRFEFRWNRDLLLGAFLLYSILCGYNRNFSTYFKFPKIPLPEFVRKSPDYMPLERIVSGLLWQQWDLFVTFENETYYLIGVGETFKGAKINLFDAKLPPGYAPPPNLGTRYHPFYHSFIRQIIREPLTWRRQLIGRAWGNYFLNHDPDLKSAEISLGHQKIQPAGGNSKQQIWVETLGTVTR
jgi:hypothetical protein